MIHERHASGSIDETQGLEMLALSLLDVHVLHCVTDASDLFLGHGPHQSEAGR